MQNYNYPNNLFLVYFHLIIGGRLSTQGVSVLVR